MIVGSAREATPPGWIRRWVMAARIPTLTAAISPVLVGASLAYRDGGFHLGATLMALWGALWIQIGTNFVNDLYDARKGADTPDRLGPPRAVALGWIAPRTMARAAWVAFGMATLGGIYLVMRGGWPILLVGVASIAAGWAYTAGPRPLAYSGWADGFVFLFFGGVAVMGTYYVNTLRISADAFWASLPMGALITNILVVNNVRDIPTDRRAGKRTLAVRWGRRGGLLEYAVLLALAYGVALGMGVWLVGLTFPMAVVQFLRLVRWEGRALNRVLKGSAQLVFLFALAWALHMVKEVAGIPGR